jgi:hypothetical protein
MFGVAFDYETMKRRIFIKSAVAAAAAGLAGVADAAARTESPVKGGWSMKLRPWHVCAAAMQDCASRGGEKVLYVTGLFGLDTVHRAIHCGGGLRSIGVRARIWEESDFRCYNTPQNLLRGCNTVACFDKHPGRVVMLRGYEYLALSFGAPPASAGAPVWASAPRLLVWSDELPDGVDADGMAVHHFRSAPNFELLEKVVLEDSLT